jgi:hypothetical protein
VGRSNKPKVGVGEGEAVAEVGSGVGVGAGVSRRGAKVGVGMGATSEGLGDSGVSPGNRRALHAVSARAASISTHDRFLRGPCLGATIVRFTHSPGDESIEGVGRTAPLPPTTRDAVPRSATQRHGLMRAAMPKCGLFRIGESPLPTGSAPSPPVGSTTPASMKPVGARLSPLWVRSAGWGFAPQLDDAGKW